MRVPEDVLWSGLEMPDAGAVDGCCTLAGSGVAWREDGVKADEIPLCVVCLSYGDIV